MDCWQAGFENRSTSFSVFAAALTRSRRGRVFVWTARNEIDALEACLCGDRFSREPYAQMVTVTKITVREPLRKVSRSIEEVLNRLTIWEMTEPEHESAPDWSPWAGRPTRLSTFRRWHKQ